MRSWFQHNGEKKPRMMFYTIVLVACLPIVLLVQGFWLNRHPDIFQKKIKQFQIQDVPCDVCNELGLVRDLKNPDKKRWCPVCFGIGSHAIRRVDPNDYLCPACGGLGRALDESTGEAKTCGRCDGRGLINSRPTENNELTDNEKSKE